MGQIVADKVSFENQIHQFFKNQRIGKLLKHSNMSKEKGISPVAVFRMLFTLVFSGKSLYRTLEAEGSCGMGKDTVYRFLNSVHIHWRRFLLLLSSQVIRQDLKPLTDASTMKVLIADDTLYRRNRSKQVELLSRVFDHTDHRYYRGFRMLALAWSDGNSFLPISCTLLASSKAKNRLVSVRTDLDRRTNGVKRRLEAIRKATDVLVEMVAEAAETGIEASHILFDSWFAYPAIMRKLLVKGMHTLCMLKVTEKIFYRYHGENLHLSAIYRRIRKRRGRAKILASVRVEIGKDDRGIPIPAKIVFVRDRRSKKWLALLSTDTGLSDDEIITTYKRRWDIEVFFKMAKSFLNLAKECQSRSYDALVAQAHVVCCRYIMLALAKRTNQDPRTLGTLFHACCEELEQVTFAEALAMMLMLLKQALANVPEMTSELIQSLIERFLKDLPPIYGARWLLDRQYGAVSS
ncbi:MAG: transposase [Lentisphaerae bacterium]|nr:transposase [Lentisphaerota bacterium]